MLMNQFSACFIFQSFSVILTIIQFHQLYNTFYSIIRSKFYKFSIQRRIITIILSNPGYLFMQSKVFTLTIFLLLGLALANEFKLNIDPTISISVGQPISIPIKCTGGYGKIMYNARGLPQGLIVDGEMIRGFVNNGYGYFPVIIQAKDQTGRSATQIITINLNKQNGQVKMNNQRISTITFNEPTVTNSKDANNRMNNVQVNTINRRQNVYQPNINPIVTSSITEQNEPNIRNQDLNRILSKYSPDQNKPNILGSNPNNPTTSSPYNLNVQIIPNPSNIQNTPNIPNNRQSYPTPDLPTGATPDNINTTPMLIEQAQAPRTAATRNQISADMIKVNAIFQRQINTNKAIANLIDIIDQLRANTNAAKSDIPTLEEQLKKQIDNQRNVQSKVITAESQRTRLTAAINNLSDNINLLKGQLGQLQSQLRESFQNFSVRKNSLINLSQNIARVEALQKDLTNQIKNQKQQLNSVQSSIIDKQTAIQKIKMDIERRNKQASNVDSQIQNAIRTIKNIDQQINDLKARVNAAVNRKLLAQQEQKRLRALKLNGPALKAQLQAELLKQNQSMDKLQQQKQGLAIDFAKIYRNLQEVNQNLNKLISEQKQIELQLTNNVEIKNRFENSIAGKNKQINDAVTTLQHLKSQTEGFDSTLRNAYNQGNDVNFRVVAARQNLDAMISKWETNSKQLEQANLNLEKARAEKQLADIAIQEILREKSNVLPYSIVPNGRGQTLAGTPTGNNPRGSPLGPLAVKNERGNNPFPQQTERITQYTNYLSSAYSRGVDPTIPSSVTKQFPFTIYHETTNLKNERIPKGSPVFGSDGKFIHGLLIGDDGTPYFIGDFACGNESTQIQTDTIEGIIKSIGLNAMKVQGQDGKIFTVKVGSCSRARANKQNYNPRTGDKIKITGKKQEGLLFSLYQASCRCEKC